ncbi:hypothetical protein HBN50_02010 [Halobacteriovorax sp. GB3]|uniref:hypothetical protein n=1 Tax=Halobacteriovorax sp. GB3 TaxID=2719615 RepID=UPI00235E877F|nr:hypothetical protein [Halobacteriovorax sp. GB3]MDD0851846.1 hypothetical protein [Halobacteriovorax sp. GB3]
MKVFSILSLIIFLLPPSVWASEADFINRFTGLLQLSLRSSDVFISHYIDCYEGNEEALKLKAIKDTEAFCKDKLFDKMDTYKEQYREMRILLSLAETSFEGDSHQLHIDWFIDRKKDQYFLPRYMKLHPTHLFSKLGDLEELSDREIDESISRLNQYFKKVALEYFEKDLTNEELREKIVALKDFERALFRKHLHFKFKSFREGVIKKYNQLLKKSPVIAFIEDKGEDITNNDINEAFKKNREIVKEVTEDVLSDIDEVTEYSDLSIFMGFKNLVARHRQLFPEDEAYLDKTEKMYQRKNMFIHGSMVGVTIGGYAICEMIKVRMIFKGLCKFTLGFVPNAVYVYVDEMELERLFNAMFASAHGEVALRNVNELNDLEFARALSWISLPFYTGAPEIIDFLRL